MSTVESYPYHIVTPNSLKFICAAYFALKNSDQAVISLVI